MNRQSCCHAVVVGLATMGITSLGISPCPAQALLENGSYFQDFDSLASDGVHPWVDNVTLPGWYAKQDGQPVTSYEASDGSAPVPSGLASFGPRGGRNRGLGNTTPRPQNTGDDPFCEQAARVRKFKGNIPMPKIVKVGVVIEEWELKEIKRKCFQMQGALRNDSLGYQDPFDWRELPGLHLDTLSTGPLGQRDGDAPENQTQLSATLDLQAIFGRPWEDGLDLWFRFVDTSESDTVDHRDAIDNFSLQVVPEPATVALLAFAAPLLLWRMPGKYYPRAQRRCASNRSLTAPS